MAFSKSAFCALDKSTMESFILFNALTSAIKLKDVSNEQEIIEMLSILSTRMITDTTFELHSNKKLHDTKVDELNKYLIKYASKLVIRKVSDVFTVEIVKTTIVFAIDVSGSMDRYIKNCQDKIKEYVLSNPNKNCDYAFFFWGTITESVSTDIKCLDRTRNLGQTNAGYVLDAITKYLQTTPAHVVFITDGDFSDGNKAYERACIENCLSFDIIFPSHTPQHTVEHHRAYLPTIVKPGTRISAMALNYNFEISDYIAPLIFTTSLVKINEIYYNQIGPFFMLKNLTSFQMASIIKNMIDSEDVKGTQSFIANVCSLYTFMDKHSGSLLNTLRSESMKMLWTLLHPLLKQIENVSEENINYHTVKNLEEFLEDFKKSTIIRRDERLSELKKLSQSDAVKQEIESIIKAFNDMKHVNSYDIMEREINTLVRKGYPVIYVKYNHVVSVIDKLLGFPNLSIAETLEIYKMYATITGCSKTDPRAIPLVLDPHMRGLQFVMCLATYNAKHESPMTLSKTQMTRILLGFMSSQYSHYKVVPKHNRINKLYLDYVAKCISPDIWNTLTNLKDPANCNPIWIRIVAIISKMFKIQIIKEPTDMTFWVKSEDVFTLNEHATTLRDAQNTADFILKKIKLDYNSQLNVSVKKEHTVRINDFKKYIPIVSGNETTALEWFNTVDHTINVNGDVIPITNGMIIVQRHKLSYALEFVEKHWLSGHRIINKNGAKLHPAATYGRNPEENRTVDTWTRESWVVCKTDLHIYNDSTHPVVTSEEMQDRVSEWFTHYMEMNPITYLTYNRELIPMREILAHLDVDPVVHDIANQLSSDPNAVATNTLPHGLPARPSKLAPEMMTVIDQIKKTIHFIMSPFPIIENDFIDTLENIYMLDDFTCPLSLEVFSSPVNFGGHKYEKTYITEWLMDHDTSPLTRQTCDKDGNPFQVMPVDEEFMTLLNKYKKKNNLDAAAEELY